MGGSQELLQLSFPELGELPGPQIKIARRPSQPHPGPDRPLVGYDLVLPLNLRQRGEISRWLAGHKFSLNEVLEEKEEKMIRLYFTPQEGRWLSQEEVAAQIGWSQKRQEAVSFGVKFALLKISRRAENGPEAIEKLKLPQFLYRGLLRAGISTFPEIPKINEEERIQQICGSSFGLGVLKEALASQGIDWQPKVEFSKFPFEK